MKKPEMDSFGRISCPGCGEFVPVITHIDKPGSPDGLTVVDVDFMPMAEHIVDCNSGPKEVRP